ncbi:hypothetical protein BJY52DRAFT_1199931 [Lactarius psammicola]|nr:hypothetical protein BJY52DRAFT_1199931 [Lactarius psammicola]
MSHIPLSHVAVVQGTDTADTGMATRRRRVPKKQPSPQAVANQDARMATLEDSVQELTESHKKLMGTQKQILSMMLAVCSHLGIKVTMPDDSTAFAVVHSTVSSIPSPLVDDISALSIGRAPASAAPSVASASSAHSSMRSGTSDVSSSDAESFDEDDMYGSDHNMREVVMESLDEEWVEGSQCSDDRVDHMDIEAINYCGSDDRIETTSGSSDDEQGADTSHSVEDMIDGNLTEILQSIYRNADNMSLMAQELCRALGIDIDSLSNTLYDQDPSPP